MHADKTLAHSIEQKLKDKGHSFAIHADTPPAGKWRQKLINALRNADVLIPILSENGLQSNYVSSEIGSARILDETRGMLLLPVIVGPYYQIPPFVSDYQCFFLQKSDDQDLLDQLITELHVAINEHVYAIPKTPSIFISHRHRDRELAKGLVELIEAAFETENKDIRCTSLPNYSLAPGERSSERLRTEIKTAKVVLGLLSPDTAESKYVLAELGASWGCDVPTFPLLVRGAAYEDVPEPLNERSCLALNDETNCFQLIEAIAQVTSIGRKSPQSHMIPILEKARELVKLCKSSVEN